MATMTISLPDRMKDWIEEQLESGHFASSSDYIRDLVRRDRDRREADRDKEERLENLRRIVAEGLASGVSTMTVEDRIAEGDRIARLRGYKSG